MKFRALRAYKKQFGHCRVPDDKKENSLGRWVQKLRSKRKLLAKHQLLRLNDLGFDWDPIANQWEAKFQELQLFHDIHGHSTATDTNSTKELGTWVQKQRSKRSKLSLSQIARLNKLSFDWDPKSNRWEENFERLRTFRDKHKHLNVSEAPSLLRWMAKQRAKKSKLSLQQRKRLEAIGFDWSPHSNAWEEMFRSLVRFKNRYRHCNVPQDSKNNPSLGSWVTTQRIKRKTLAKDRVARLDKIGFDWDPKATIWEQRFQELKDFKIKNGHCNVPLKYLKNPKLAKWVTNLRGKDNQSQERKQRLNKLGFDWAPKNTKWMEKYAELKAYKSKFGDCEVPLKYSSNPALGMWVQNTRATKKLQTKERLKLLNSIGFRWPTKLKR